MNGTRCDNCHGSKVRLTLTDPEAAGTGSFHFCSWPCLIAYAQKREAHLDALAALVEKELPRAPDYPPDDLGDGAE